MRRIGRLRAVRGDLDLLAGIHIIAVAVLHVHARRQFQVAIGPHRDFPRRVRMRHSSGPHLMVRPSFHDAIRPRPGGGRRGVGSLKCLALGAKRQRSQRCCQTEARPAPAGARGTGLFREKKSAESFIIEK